MTPFMWQFENGLKYRLNNYVFNVSKKTKWKRGRR